MRASWLWQPIESFLAHYAINSTYDFLEHSKRLAAFTDCIDTTKETDSSAVERCEDVRSAMFKAIEKERLERYPMLDPDKQQAEISAIFK